MLVPFSRIRNYLCLLTSGANQLQISLDVNQLFLKKYWIRECSLREGGGKKWGGASNFYVARKGGVSDFSSVKRGVSNFPQPSQSFPAPIT